MTNKRNCSVDAAGAPTAAREDHAAVVELTQELVRIPSRSGIPPGQTRSRPMSRFMLFGRCSCFQRRRRFAVHSSPPLRLPD
jgi:hypothetical protein